MVGKKVIYGYNDPIYAITCTVIDITFRGMDILLVATCDDGGTIIAPIEMFKKAEEGAQ